MSDKAWLIPTGTPIYIGGEMLTVDQIQGRIETAQKQARYALAQLRAHIQASQHTAGAALGPIQGYWLLQVLCGDPMLRGPYATDAERENELDMCLIDPGTEYIFLIDPDTPPHAWKPSKDYCQERMDRLDNLPDEVTP